MTRKQYRRIAKYLHQARQHYKNDLPMVIILDRLENFWIDILARDNPRFNAAKFKEASHGNE